MTAASIDRKECLGLLARASLAKLKALWPNDPPQFEWLRRPETGAMMVQGRAGATGAAFNLGEVTVTRASVRLGCGTLGHALVQGRDPDKAERAALFDALLQTADAARVQAQVIAPLRAAEEEAHAVQARRTAATKVDFFTMVRGEG